MLIEETVINLPDPGVFEKETLRFLSDFNFSGLIPSLDHIAAVSRYFSRLPYENISKIIKREQRGGELLFRLPDELTEDHFAWHLGGTCFSLTYFLTGIYTILGYEVKPLICQLNWGKNNHSAIRINFAGRHFLVDPGYMIFTPLPMTEETVHAHLSAETGLQLRFLEESESYALYTFRQGQSVRRYRFVDEVIPLSEFAQFWSDSFNQPGMDNLTLTQVRGDEMLFIQGDFVKITRPDQIQKIRQMDLAEKLIKERFSIPLEKLEEARFLLQQR
ncbi:arylamine N-acetyltransferase [bacterium]|nr:arylamine N-acetyltransferase [bacterium]